MKNKLTSQLHYSYPVRLAIEFYNNKKLPDVHSIDVEPTYGRVARITYKDGSVRMLYSNGLDINNSESSKTTKDKGYSKYFLNNLGYATPVGKVFLLPKRIKKIVPNLSTRGFKDYAEVRDIYTYIDTIISYPCFIKPNQGRKGLDVHKCFNHLDVQSVIEEYEKEDITVLIVEEFVDLPNYRINVLGDEIFCCYLRKPLSIIGDGKSSIQSLLLQKKDNFIKEGKPAVIKIDDPRISHILKRNSLSFDNVLSEGHILYVHDFSNFPTGGEAEDCTEKIHPYWKDMCIKITKEMGLLLCGIDFFCTDIEDPQAKYSVLELNSSPGLENYAAMGEKQKKIVHNLYLKFFNESTLNYSGQRGFVG